MRMLIHRNFSSPRGGIDPFAWFIIPLLGGWRLDHKVFYFLVSFLAPQISFPAHLVPVRYHLVAILCRLPPHLYDYCLLSYLQHLFRIATVVLDVQGGNIAVFVRSCCGEQECTSGPGMLGRWSVQCLGAVC